MRSVCGRIYLSWFITVALFCQFGASWFLAFSRGNIRCVFLLKKPVGWEVSFVLQVRSPNPKATDRKSFSTPAAAAVCILKAGSSRERLHADLGLPHENAGFSHLLANTQLLFGPVNLKSASLSQAR